MTQDATPRRPGRPKGEPTELARLSRDQVRKLVTIAKRRDISVREALAQIAGDDIDRVFAAECESHAEIGGES